MGKPVGPADEQMVSGAAPLHTLEELGYETGEELRSTLLSLKYNPVIRVRIESPVEFTLKPGLAKGEEKKLDLCRVVNLDTGEVATLIVPALISGKLRDLGEAYVGRCYEMRRLDPVPGKRYIDYSVVELRPRSGSSVQGT